MLSPILAFRPASVVERLPPRSAACPLSLRDLLGPAAELGVVLPVVRAPLAGVAQAALVAAKQLQAVIGLALPPGTQPEPWFEGVTRAADQIAAGLPIFLSAEVTLEGEGALQVEKGFQEAWRLVDAGVTHLAVDASAVDPVERGRVVAEVAQAAVERGACLDLIVPADGGPHPGRRAAALVEELAGRGVQPDLASLRFAAPADADDARAQVGALARLCQALQGLPVMRRGPVSRALFPLLAGSPVKVCDDGGAAADRAVGVIPFELLEGDEAESRRSRVERAAAELSADGGERLEARAYVEVLELVERLGAAGSQLGLVRALERRLAEG